MRASLTGMPSIFNQLNNIVMSEITFFAKTNFRNEEKKFGIKQDDRRRHMYIIGKTGMGKTNLLETMAIQDIRRGHGIAYIDPHGDTAEKLLKAIPSNRINDVIYFNPSDQDYPIAFNPMENTDPEMRHLTASGLLGVFKKSGMTVGVLDWKIHCAILFWPCLKHPIPLFWEFSEC